MRAHFRPAIFGPAVAAVLITGALLAPAASFAATPVIKFDLEMFSQCFGGRGVADSTLAIQWRNSGGTLKAAGSAQANVVGRFSFCSTDANTWLEPGDMLKASDGTNVRKYTVPNLYAEMDRVNNVAKGTGPANRTVRFCSTFAIFGDFEQCHLARVDDDGTWAYNPHTDIVGGLFGSLNWKSPKDDTFYQNVSAPQLVVTLGRAAFSGNGAPRDLVDVSTDGANDGSAQVMSNGDGVFSGQLRDSQGHLANVTAGDHLVSSISSDADWIVPQIDATADKATDVVSGKCWDTGTSDHEVFFEVSHSGHSRGAGITDTDADGNFSIDLGEDPGGFFDQTNLIAGDRVLVQCRQTTGDFAQLKIVVP